MIEFAPAHIVGTGGALGAILRHLVSQRVDGEEFPAATFVVNAVGSLVLGFLTFAGVGGEIALLVGTGACGSFTTFSSFSYETVRLWETGEHVRAATNAIGTLAVCLLMVGIGQVLATVAF